LKFRNYAVTTGWRIPNNAAALPAMQDFVSIDVDYSRFLRAPEKFYKSGALDGVSIASTALVAAILATTF